MKSFRKEKLCKEDIELIIDLHLKKSKLTNFQHIRHKQRVGRTFEDCSKTEMSLTFES